MPSPEETSAQGPANRALPRGRIKASPEDFRVDEVPSYEPSGEGSHLFIRFEKRGLTTDDAARAIANALGVDFREVGIAGLKDKHAVTTQWISLLTPAKDPNIAERALALTLDRVKILEAKRHGNKLKTGHLRGNTFEIVVREIPLAFLESSAAAFRALAESGVPNAFGDQRFGKSGETVEQARAWLTGKARAPANPRLRRFHFSALQSSIFNAVLEARVADGSWLVPLAGDLLKKEDTGGLFLCTDVQTDRERAARGELCPTGPIVGDRMRQPEADALALEERIIAPLIAGIDLHRARSLGEGTRRALRLRVADIDATVADPTGPANAAKTAEVMKPAAGPELGALRVRFVLPKGAYATTVLKNVFDIVEEDRTGNRASSEPDDADNVGRTEEE